MDRLPVGASVAGFTVDGVLGAGGMGTVYRVVDSDGRAFAMKVMPRPPERDEATFDARLTREANVARVVRHPGVVTVFGHGALPSGDRFLVMELLRGRDLDRCLELQTLSLLEYLELFREVVGVLEVAHGIVRLDGTPEPLVHRDLKPANVFLLDEMVEDTRVKVVDFGLVRQTGSSNETQNGVGFGTPNYMAPEQFGDAKSSTPATDVWALGVMIYEVVSGTSPFAADTIQQTFLNVLRGHPPRLDTLVPDCPSQIADLVDACLEPEMTRRHADARVFSPALDELLATESVRAFCRSRRALDCLNRASSELRGSESANPGDLGSMPTRHGPEVHAPTAPVNVDGSFDAVAANKTRSWLTVVVAVVAAALGYFAVRFALGNL